MNELETMLSQFGPADWLLCNDYCGRFLSNAADMIAGTRKGRLPAVSGNVAVIPIEGVMTPKGGWYGVGTQQIGRVFDAAVASPGIGAIVFDMDTPGGMSWGTPELAQKIYDARGSKPTVAIANHLSASAGLFVGTAADKFMVAPSGHVGSLGVFRYHVDYSKALEVGMVDRMATLDQVLSELAPPEKPKRGRERAEELTAMLCAAWEGESVEAEPQGVPVDALKAARERRAREVA